MIEKLFMAGETGFRIRPCHFQLPGGFDGIPFFFGDNPEKVLDPDGLRPGNVGDRFFVHGHGYGARYRWANHPCMDHIRQFEIRDLL